MSDKKRQITAIQDEANFNGVATARVFPLCQILDNIKNRVKIFKK